MREIAVGVLAIVCSLEASWVCAQDELIRKIINGIETEEYPAVGIVGNNSFGGFCTGTLIDSTHVLTAAHYAEEIPNDTSGTFEVDGQVYTTSRVIMHPDYDTITLENDIAILELSEPVEGVEAAITSTFVPEVGDLVTIVGFGSGGDGESGEDGTFGTKRVGTTILDTVTETTITALFDSNDDSNPAPGDSGGPLFASIDGTDVIVGIVSAGTVADASLGDNSINTRVDAFSLWIDEVLLGAIDEPVDSPTDEPVDEDPVDEEPADEETNECPPVACFWATWSCFFVCNPCWSFCCTAADTVATEDATSESADEASAVETVNSSYRNRRAHAAIPSAGIVALDDNSFQV